jgi:hypothetical protein
MTCIKRQTRATLITPHGKRFVATNDCGNPQKTCPRGDMPTGVGYELCFQICQQRHHAEAGAIAAAGPEASGSKVYLEGHDYICSWCQELADRAGAKIIIGPPPKLSDAPWDRLA